MSDPADRPRAAERTGGETAAMTAAGRTADNDDSSDEDAAADYEDWTEDAAAENVNGDAFSSSEHVGANGRATERHDRPAGSNGTASGRRELPDVFKLGRIQVGVGQEYVKLDAGPDPWQVLSIFAGPGDVPHARIVRVTQPGEVRVVALAALVDRHRYRPI
jgi:hypothetical protein